MPTRLLSRSIIASLLVLALLVVANAVVSVRQARALRAHAARVAETQETLRAIGDATGALRAAESAQRSYLLAGDPSLRDEHGARLADARAALGRLSARVPAGRRGALAAVDRDVAALAAFWARTMTVRDRDGLAAAQAIVTGGGSRRMLADIAARRQTIGDAERARLAERDRATDRALEGSIAAAVFAAVVALAALALFAALLRRHFAARQRAALEIHEQRQLFLATLASIGDGVIATDREGRVTFLNAVAETLTGWRAEEAIGEPLGRVFDILNEETRAVVENPALRALAAGTIVGLANHTVLVARDGSERPIDDSAAPIRDPDGNVSGAVLVFRDGSAKRDAERALRASEERFRLAADAVGGIIYDFDLAAGTVQRMRGLREVLGWEPGEVPASADWWWSQLHPEDRERFRGRTEEALRAGENVVHRYRVRHRDGRWLTVEDRGLTLLDADGRPTRLIGCTVDVTAEVEAEATLRRSEAEYRSLFETSGIGNAEVDLESGRFLRVNRRYCEIVGWSAEELLGGMTSPGITHPDDRARHVEQMQAFMREESESFEIQKRYLRRDGTPVWVHLVGTLIRDDRGRPVRLLASVHDVTERRLAEERLRESESRFREIADSSPIVVWMTDAEGGVEFVNRAYCEFFGIAIEKREALGHWWRPVVHPDDEAASVGTFLAALRAGEPWNGRSRVRDAAGAWRWVDSRAVPRRGPDGAPLGAVGISVDITEVVRAQQALEEADRRKDEFLATLAHELRNPLSPLRNGLELLRLDPGPAAGAQVREMMERQVGQLARLVDDLMDVSRITRGKLALYRERVPLAEAIRSAVETSRPAIERSGQALAVVEPPPEALVEADLTRLAQAFVNVLTNAAKYGRAGGTVRLATTIADGVATVVVADEGIGIAPEQLPRIFDLFTQVDGSVARAEGGLGIGLSLARRLVEMHGGTLEARSEGLGRGTELVFRLPLVATAPAGEAAPPRAARDAQTPLRILVVDDNRDAADSLAMMLGMLGHAVKTAYDGAEAEALARDLRPQVVLLDLGLPGVSGFEVCRRIRAVLGTAPVVVAQTGWGQDEDRRRTREAGFDHHLVKPVEISALLAILSSLPAGGDAAPTAVS